MFNCPLLNYRVVYRRKTVIIFCFNFCRTNKITSVCYNGLPASGCQCVVEFVNVKTCERCMVWIQKLHIILDSADVDVVGLTEAPEVNQVRTSGSTTAVTQGWGYFCCCYCCFFSCSVSQV